MKSRKSLRGKAFNHYSLRLKDLRLIIKIPMTNSEEDILARFLQDTFSDYEPEPSDITWEHIRKEIQPQQPGVGAGLRQWIIPVVALFLLIGGIAFNWENTENNSELAMNSTKEKLKNDPQIIDYQQINTKKSTKQNTANINEKSEKLYVNKTTSNVESKVLFEVEKPFEVPTFSTTKTASIAKQNVQEYAVNKKEFVGIEDKSVALYNAIPVIVSVYGVSKTDNGLRKVVSLGDPVNTDYNMEEKSQKSFNLTNSNSDILSVVSVPINNSVNDATIQEVRYIKPLETLKNKDFVLIKNQIILPKINAINIYRESKPVRRPLFVSMSFTPLQTYRILTVNSQNIQNLQTNNTFDSERNGWAFDLGITKQIGNKWNLRSGISYLKMRQWAEYQVNTNNISVKNSNNYSNAVSVGNNDNEFIGQTRIEQKTLQMVGLKADVQRFFKVTGRNRYFISGGSQLMYESTQKQSNIFINASAGFQHLVNKDCFLTIEPTASYLLNNINDSKSLIQTNAYNLGLKVGLSFRVK